MEMDLIFFLDFLQIIALTIINKDIVGSWLGFGILILN